MKFRKKPVVIDAHQFMGAVQQDFPPWIADALAKIWGEHGSVQLSGDRMAIWTLEGVHDANPGDWIIRGVEGELYPCKPSVFAATYEPADGEALGKTLEGK